MLTTTFTQKLLAKAADYEAKAAALRIAAAEMNGQVVAEKQGKAQATIEAAIALRNGQRNGHEPAAAGVEMNRLQRAKVRNEAIRTFLAEHGPQHVRAIAAHLEPLGLLKVGVSMLGKILGEMDGVQLEGMGVHSKWYLGEKPKRRKAIPGRSLMREKRKLIAQVLDRYDTTTPKIPGDVAKALGLTVAQSGLAPLVNMGYLKRKGTKGYVRTRKPYVVDNRAAETSAASD
jgi:hypothetical protein